MANSKRVIVWAERPMMVGTVMEADRDLMLAESRGQVATLPFDERLIVRGPVHGYFRRDWGFPGVALRDMRPQKECPMLMWVSPDVHYVHFAVGVQPISENNIMKRPRGTIRLAPMSTTGSAFMGGLGAVGAIDINLDALEFPPENEGWVTRGRCTLNVQAEGYLGCCLNAVAEGVRVMWTAVTQSRQEQ